MSKFNFEMTKAVKKTGGSLAGRIDDSEPRLKATSSFGRFDLNPKAVELMGLQDEERVNILHDEDSGTFALCKAYENEEGAMVKILENKRGRFHYSGKYLNFIGRSTGEAPALEDLIEEGIIEETVTKAGNTKKVVNHVVMAEMGDVEVMEINGIEREVFILGELVKHEKLDINQSHSDEDSDEDSDV